MKDIFIIGAGGHGAVIIDIALSCGYTIAGIVDDDPALHGSFVLDWPVMGGRDVIHDGACVALAIGRNAVRADYLRHAQSHGWILPVLAHPTATISSFASLGYGTVVMPHVVVNTRTSTGCGCILNTACSVDHDCLLGEAVHIAPGVRLAGNVTIGDQTLIGIGSCARPGITIGANAVVGAGSVLIADIPAGVIAFGNPAHVHSRVSAK